MNAFGYGYWALIALSGWLAWRGTHNFMRAFIAGLFAPLIALIAFGALIGRAEFEQTPPGGDPDVRFWH